MNLSEQIDVFERGEPDQDDMLSLGHYGRLWSLLRRALWHYNVLNTFDNQRADAPTVCGLNMGSLRCILK